MFVLGTVYYVYLLSQWGKTALMYASECWDGVACVMVCVCPWYSILCVSSITVRWDCSHVCIVERTPRLCGGTPAKGC